VKAIVTSGNGAINIGTAAMPVIGDYDCLVKIKTCLFCNSTDRHIIDGTFDFGIQYPCILGHESIGQIISVGSKVKNFASGDWVTSPNAVYPGEVENGMGSGFGGFAEFGKIRDSAAMSADGIIREQDITEFFRYMQKIPAELSPDKCFLIGCSKEIYSSVKQIIANGGINGRSFLIAGAGAAGCLFALFLKINGAENVSITARQQGQLDFALKSTPVDKAIPFSELNLHGRSFDALIDTTGSSAAVNHLLDNPIHKDGYFYSYAVYPEMAQKEFFENFKKRIRFLRIDPVESSTHDEICRMLMHNILDTSSFITYRFNIDDAAQAWATVRDKKTVKTAVLFE